jgi:integrase
LNGVEVRESLDLRNWEKAQEKVWNMEVTGKMPAAPTTPTTLAQAGERFLADAEARKLAPATIRKYKQTVKQICDFGRTEGAELLQQWDIGTARRFRESWKDGALTVTKKLERLRGLFRFAQENDWIKQNPATKLKSPVVRRTPTMPFSADEMLEILDKCDEYRGDQDKMRAFVLLMRYSGLRVGDAARLARDRIANGKLFLYTAKTGTPVWVPPPPVTLEALTAFQPANNTNFFWSGESSADTVAKLWMRKLQWLFERTEIAHAHSHRFRDTFAVEMLLSGVPMERVSVLLGHGSIRVTERHYAPWVKARQEQLEADVKRSWERDGIAKGTQEVHEKSNVVKIRVAS